MIPKFRAWDKKRSRMFKVNAIRFKHPNGFEPTVLVYKGNGAESTLKLDDCILMQSIGLYDYRGVEVFEGDIVKIYSEFGDEVATVNFNGLEFYLQSIDPFKHMDPDIVDESLSDLDLDLEVMGNIYENKELLDEKFKFYNR